MRNLVQLGISLICVGLIGGGLFFSMGPSGEGLILDRPGSPGRLMTAETSATAFFELNGDTLELTMLFTEPADPDSVFRTRVRLMDGQSHSIVVGESDEGSGAQRYTFRRIGYTVEMRSAPAAPLTASFRVHE
ncbi:MAG: hypothetical protein AAF557_12755 [Pseudomonadota bacterium]